MLKGYQCQQRCFEVVATAYAVLLDEHPLVSLANIKDQYSLTILSLIIPI